MGAGWNTRTTRLPGPPTGVIDGVDLLRLVERVALLLPGVPRLAILDAVEAERERLRALPGLPLSPFVVTAAVWRLRAALDPSAPA